MENDAKDLILLDFLTQSSLLQRVRLTATSLSVRQKTPLMARLVDAAGLSCTSALEAPSSSATTDDTETTAMTESNDSLPAAIPAATTAPADPTAAEQTIPAVPRARNHTNQLVGSLSFMMTQAVQHRRPSSRDLLTPLPLALSAENANDVEESSRGNERAGTELPSATSVPGIALELSSSHDDDARRRRRSCRDARRRMSITGASPGNETRSKTLSPMSAMMARRMLQGVLQSQSSPL